MISFNFIKIFKEEKCILLTVLAFEDIPCDFGCPLCHQFFVTEEHDHITFIFIDLLH